MNWRKIFSMLFVAVVAVGVVAFAVTNGSVAAQTPTPQHKDPTAQAANAAARLEKLYQAELKMLDNQSKLFDKVNELSAKVNDLVAKAKAKGKDTAALEAGMTQFSTKISDAKKIHDAAASLIQAHAGFDANGKMVDRAAAKDTVQNGRSQLQDVRQAVGGAMKDFRATAKAWRGTNKVPTPTPATTSAQ